jgi:hypothetical protein
MELANNAASGPFAGWEVYPSNIGNLFPHHDVESSGKRLANDADRLFARDSLNVRISTVLKEDQGGKSSVLDDRIQDLATFEKVLLGMVHILLRFKKDI